ncbi:DNA polymerase III, alpha subunit domain protein [Paenibacillus macerans]|uniref:DNA polymerase III, alpha subunit domain protein n=1 Tax=Paenibacillus macerans TaxID=44252 RepID=A0A090Y4G0_PAEMA|nr:DNA polymerase III, alpha subunit domain protein [Paenibacillus macerans]
MCRAAPPHFGKQHDLAALDLVLQLHEGHRLALLRRDRFDRHDHPGHHRPAFIRRFGQIHQPVGAFLLKQLIVIVQRMAGQVQSEQLPLQFQLLRGGKRPNIRVLDVPVWRFHKIEQLDLQILTLLAPFKRGFHRLVQHRQQLGAVPREGVKRAALNQRFDNALVARAQIDAAAKIEQAVERPLLPLAHNAFDRLGADVFDRCQPEADHPQGRGGANGLRGIFSAGSAGLPPRRQDGFRCGDVSPGFRASRRSSREAPVRSSGANPSLRRKQHAAFVHVRRQHGDAHPPAFDDILRHLAVAAHNGCQHRGHELDGIMRLQIRRLERQHAIGGRMRPREAVIGKADDHIVYSVRFLGGITLVQAAADEMAALLVQHLPLFLRDGAPQQIGFSQGKSRHFGGDLHDLLLINDDPIRVVQY